jgi:hypothetical protein
VRVTTTALPTLRVKLRPLVTGPGAPTGLTVTATVDGVTVTGTAPAGTLVRLYEDNVLVATDEAPGAFSFTRTPAPGQHTYRVEVYDADTERASPSPTYTVVRPLRPPVTGATVTVNADGDLVEWEAMTGATGYRVDVVRNLVTETNPNTGVPTYESVLETVELAAGVLAYNNTESPDGTETTYTVRWKDAQGYLSAPAPLKATRPMPNTPVPVIDPPSITEWQYAGTSLVIVWAPADYPSTVRYRETGTQTWTVASTNATTSPFTITGIDPAKGYDVEFYAVNGAQESARASTTTTPPPPEVIVTGNIHVDPVAGDDANAGDSSAPFRTIPKSGTVAVAGDTVVVHDGTYDQTLTTIQSGTASFPITFRALNAGGVIMDGSNSRAKAINLLNRRFIKVEDFIVQRFFSGFDPQDCAITPGNDCTLTNCISRLNVGGGFGLSACERTSLIGCTGEDNGLDGLQGSRARGVLIKNFTSRRNNFGHPLNAARAAATPGRYRSRTVNGVTYWFKYTDSECAKFSRSRGIRFEGGSYTANNGLSLWADIDNQDWEMYGVTGDSFAFEISPGPMRVENNTWSFFGFWESTHGIITKSTIGRTNATDGVLQIRQQPIKRSFIDHQTNQRVQMYFDDLAITHNTILGGYIHSDGPAFASPTVNTDLHLSIDYNQYRPSKGRPIIFIGSYATGRVYEIPQARARGYELHGGPVVRAA